MRYRLSGSGGMIYDEGFRLGIYDRIPYLRSSSSTSSFFLLMFSRLFSTEKEEQRRGEQQQQPTDETSQLITTSLTTPTITAVPPHTGWTEEPGKTTTRTTISFDGPMTYVDRLMRRILVFPENRIQFEKFPYFMNDHNRNQLIHLANIMMHRKDVADRLKCLQHGVMMIDCAGMPSSEVYLETIVKGLAEHMEADMLRLTGEDLSSDKEGPAAETTNSTPNEDAIPQPDLMESKMYHNFRDMLNDLDKILHREESNKTKRPMGRFRRLPQRNNKKRSESSEDTLRTRMMEIFEALRRISDRPKILFIRDIRDSITEEMTNTFIDCLEKERRRQKLIVIGTTEQEMMDEDDQERDHMPPILSRLVLSIRPGGQVENSRGSNSDVVGDSFKDCVRVTFLVPKEMKTYDQFKKQLEKDWHEMIQEDNARLFVRVTLLIDPKWVGELSQMKPWFPTKPMTMTDMEKVVAYLLNYDSSLPLSKPLIEQALNACFLEDHHTIQRESMTTTTTTMMTGPTQKKLGPLNSHERKLLHCLIQPEGIQVRFDNIGSLQSAKQLLREIIMWPLQKPHLFDRGILRHTTTGILLFGPPGTGKTMLAKAIAKESGANFLSVTGSSILDMYVGQGEKNAKALFTLASKLRPCVIFMDEVDNLLSARGSANHYTTKREVLNELMAAWDGLQSSPEGVIVMAATNRPFDLDEAVLRRLPRRIFIDLPDTVAREKILHVLLKDEILDGDIDVHTIAERTPLFSGSDLKHLCITAAMMSVRDCLSQSDTTIQRKLLMSHFEKALRDFTPSLSGDSTILTELRKWDALYGEAGKRRKLTLGF
jgi:ATP-dependent 26S proteasome regulatory subunit